MKANRLLQLHEEGRDSFVRENLCGQSFVGQDLSGIDLSYVNIRGANFSKANLTECNLEGAYAGSEGFWVSALLVFCFLISMPVALALIILGITILATETLRGSKGSFLLGTILLGAFATAITFLIREVKRRAFGETWTVSWIALAASSMLWAVVSSVIEGDMLLGAITGAGSTATAFVGQVGMIWGFTASWIVGGKRVVPFSIGLYCTAIASLYWVCTAIGGLSQARAFLISLLAMTTVFLIALYVSRQAIRGDRNFEFVHRLSVAFATVGGTSFREANLTNVNFSKAILEKTNFRKNALLGTYLKGTKGLHHARCGDTYMTDLSVRNLVTTGQGKSQKFDELDLEGINLKEGDLRRCSFITTNLNYANLRGSDLSGAVLKQTQLDNADLTGANLTGAYIEDWGITTRTRLESIRCDYVYMRFPSPDSIDQNRHRKPDDWKRCFVEGEFSDFIAPLVETLDLYHNQDVDPRALSLAFYDLREQNPDAGLNIVSMEKRGKQRNKLLLRAEASSHTNLSDLHNQYFSRYEYLVELPPQELRKLIIEKDRQTEVLTELAIALNDRPSQTSITYYQNKGDVNVSEQTSNSRHYDFSTAQFSGGFAEVVQGNQVGGIIVNEYSQLDNYTKLLSNIRQQAETFPGEHREHALKVINNLDVDIREPEPSSRKIVEKVKQLLAIASAVSVFVGSAAAFSGDLNDFTNNVIELTQTIGISMEQIQSFGDSSGS